ncbi:Sulfite reductase (NADPH) alpha subunit [Staphylococcus aureus]|uniref:Sulfite reductase (NADPH) alpha subunit n=1 Tax=Staphylococcus aureus TaxID=1280 RepID=A0A2X2JZ26_STAAU|nr:Sulfite reductase (NADPH) alpha subunit [Staphylococcus aureus]
MRLAEIFSERLSDIGHQVVLMSMDEYDTTNIAQLEDLFIITSTHGEGEPPDNAWISLNF